MLKENLLLDSARSFSSDSNIFVGHPENTSMGVPSSYLMLKRQKEREQLKWYVLRISYSRELKVQKHLNELGVKTFVPMKWSEVETKGKKTKVLVPAVNNFCFAYWSFNALLDYIKMQGENPSVHFYWDRTQLQYMSIPEDEMENFIKVASAIDTDILYLNEVSEKFRQGQLVTVTDGPFKGVTGKIIRVKKSRRILVELPGVLAVATAYINPQCLTLTVEA